MSDSVSLENCDAWLVAVVVVFVIVISSRIASGRRAAGARRDEEGACALFCGAQAQPHARGLLRAFASRISRVSSIEGLGLGSQRKSV